MTHHAGPRCDGPRCDGPRRSAGADGVCRRLLMLLVAVIAGIGVLVGNAGTAHAEDAYRYWGYFQGSGDTWAFAQKGAAESNPADGSVEGWRYGAATSGTPRMPRVSADFNQICGGAPPENGKKRVAVVIDQGVAADAPSGQQPNPKVQGVCVLAAPDATGAQVLAATGPVRVENSMTCGVAGYPQTGCSEKVQLTQTPSDEKVQLTVLAPVGGSTAGNTPGQSPAQPGTSGGSSSTMTIILVAVILVVLIGAGLVLGARRRRNV